MRRVSALLLAGAGAVAARVLTRALVTTPELERTNYRGRTVSLAGGPALATAAAVSAAAGAGSLPMAGAALTAGLGSAAVGFYDDVVGQRPEQKAKGLGGHFAALREGRVTSGAVKVAGIGISALVAARLADRSRGRGPFDTVLGAGVIAGMANVVNLLDLRPGRALKVGLAVGVPASIAPGGAMLAGPVGAAAAVLPDDLGERVMLGDCGANGFGALLGLALARRTGRGGRAAILAGLAGLILASEKVSFTRVIESTPVLRELDAWGRGTIPPAR